MNILFVCTGNTCRSPMAEALLRHKSEKVNVKSAGVFAAQAAPASSHALQVLQEKGIDFHHRSQAVTDELLAWANLILTMTIEHKQILSMKYPNYEQKFYTLKEYNEKLNLNISDPFGGSLEQYRETRKEIEAEIDDLIDKLQ